MKLFVADMSYRTAPIEIREKLTVTPSRIVPQICRLQVESELDEVVLLSTRNRVEIYGVTRDESGSADSLLKAMGGGELNFRRHGYVRENDEAVRQLFRVASGLDSMVLGETEAVGQGEDRL
jgi:glutamyl-tRNA reductase